MKVNNYISMLFLAGAAMIASCSQNEELGGDNPDALRSEVRRVRKECRS